MAKVEKHFVTFYSPGTFVAEESTREIANWDVMLAVEMSRAISERYEARPHGFRFTTRARGDADLDSKVTATSCCYYIDGMVETREEIEARNDPKESILRSNMRINDIARVVVTCSSWKHTAVLNPGDVVLNNRGQVIHTEPKS